MRILVNKRLCRHDGERGAVAVTAALLMLVLLGVAAFTVDFGFAYVSKRQLQTAADSAALAGASAYVPYSGNCATLLSNSAARAAAEAAAKRHNDENRPESSGAFSVECSAGDNLEVTYTSNGSTPTFLAGLFGEGDSIAATRSATAAMSVPPDKPRVGVRPYAVCGSFIPTTATDEVVKVEGPSKAHTPPPGCPTGKNPGNWWTLDCPGTTNNGEKGLAEQIRNGCQSGMSVVPNQPVGGTSENLSKFLTDSCPTVSKSCLGANPGNMSGQMPDAWKFLVDEQDPILLPVFCGEPKCKPAALNTDKAGNNSIYPVHSFIAVTVCGYRWADKGSAQSSSATCNNNPNNYKVSDGDKDSNFLLLVISRIQTSGDTEESNCKLGDPACDNGLRRVLLTK